MNIIAQVNSSSVIIADQHHTTDTDWLNYFDPIAALKSVVAHVATLPSSDTPEKHTMRVYESGLKYFIAWLAGHEADPSVSITAYARLPLQLVTEAVMKNFIGHLSAKGLASSTIANKYQIPARHWLRALAKQRPTVSGEFRDRAENYRAALIDAVDVPAPRSKTKTTRSALYANGYRMSLSQINDLFAHIAQENTLSSKRDLALTYIGITSALRVAEISRITLAKIVPGESSPYEIHVRGKGGQVDPVAVDNQAVQLIHAWVNAWNAAIADPSDPRYIHKDTPLWHPIRADRPEQVGCNNYDPSTGLGRHGIAGIINRHSEAAIGKRVNPHDLRRTYAARSTEAGIPLNVVSRQLRHQSIATTQRYIGEPPNMGAAILSNHVQLIVPVPA